jgi:hypothetical protein
MAEEKMIKVSVFYPGGQGKQFGMKYYCERHIPLLQKICGDSPKSVAVRGNCGNGAGFASALCGDGTFGLRFAGGV